jgi:hypothetical protein
MKWSEEEIERCCEAMHGAYETAAAAAGWATQERSRKPWAEVPEANKTTMRTAVPVAMTRALEFVAARGGTMTAGRVGDVLRTIDGWCTESVSRDIRDHLAAQGARVAVLEKEQESLERHVVLLTERLSAAEESNRELTRRAQQAEAKVEVLKMSLRSSEERGKLLFDSKNHWADRARAAETRCAALSAAGQVLSEHVDKCAGEPDCGWHNGGPCETCKDAAQQDDMDLMCRDCKQCTVHSWNGRNWWCHECSGISIVGRSPCSPTCTHDDAKTTGHPERVKKQSEAFSAVAEARARSYETGVSDGYSEGAEAMRAACWEAVQEKMQQMAWTPRDPPWGEVKAAIEGATP